MLRAAEVATKATESPFEHLAEWFEDGDEDDAVEQVEEGSEGLGGVVVEVAVSESEATVVSVAGEVVIVVALLQVSPVEVVGQVSVQVGHLEDEPGHNQKEEGPHQKDVDAVLFQFGLELPHHSHVEQHQSCKEDPLDLVEHELGAGQGAALYAEQILQQTWLY